jgi:sulfoxide reductase catalytic subunit YedY
VLIRKSSDIASSEITPKETYLSRRKFMLGAAAAGITAAAAERLSNFTAPEGVMAATKLTTVKSSLSTTGETLTSYKDITTYNNFYEFGTDKGDPSQNAHTLQTRPWTVSVEGLMKKPQSFDIDAMTRYRPQEERVFRHRCVEGWSMVIPWTGYSLSEFIKVCNPLPSAKYVQFLSLADPKQMPLLRSVGLDWPYSEGLRMDEAMHPLATLAFGLYGETLPNQDGAPVRIILPWKYGFKSAKSIVKVRFVADMPKTTWNEMAANEYGFYSNVNPNVDHPRWSQKTERRIGEPIWKQRRPTLMFNGYGDQVASLYNGMDLKKNY